MKRILLLSIALIIVIAGKAQSNSDAKKLIYYERYKSAGNLIDSLLKAERYDSPIK